MSAVAVHIESSGDSNGSDFAYPVQLYNAFDGWHREMPLFDYACCTTLFSVFNVKSVCSKSASAKLYPADIVTRLYPSAGKSPM